MSTGVIYALWLIYTGHQSLIATWDTLAECEQAKADMLMQMGAIRPTLACVCSEGYLPKLPAIEVAPAP